MRESNMELLRIFCMFGIVCLHTCGPFLRDASGISLIYFSLFNSIFNTGVTLFVLISGYFGIRSSGRKVFSLWLQVFLYSLLGAFVMYWGGDSSALDANHIKSVILPVSSNKYWFVTAYVVLMIFSPWLNELASFLHKKSLFRLVLILLIVFSVIPTFLRTSLPCCSKGKDIPQILMVYMIGRYIAMYCNYNFSKIKLLSVAFCALLFVFCSGIALSVYMYPEGGCYFPASDDSSLFLVSASICLFLIFRKFEFYSQPVNFVSAHILAVYLMEFPIRMQLERYINLSSYVQDWYFPAVLFGYVLLVMTIAILIDIVRTPVQRLIENGIDKLGTLIVPVVKKCLSRWFDFVR